MRSETDGLAEEIAKRAAPGSKFLRSRAPQLAAHGWYNTPHTVFPYGAHLAVVRIDADTQHCYKTPRIGRIRSDGQFAIVWSAPQPIAPEPYPRTRTAAEWKAFLHDLYTGWGNQWAAPAAAMGGK